MRLPIANDYNTVDCRRGFAHESYVWIPGGSRVVDICRLKRIRYGKALVGFKQSGNKWIPEFDGVVVAVTGKEKVEGWMSQPYQELVEEQKRKKELAAKQWQQRLQDILNS